MLTGERLPRQMEKRAEKIEAIADTELRQLVVLCCTNDPTQRPDIQKCISILEDLERATSISASIDVNKMNILIKATDPDPQFEWSSWIKDSWHMVTHSS